MSGPKDKNRLFVLQHAYTPPCGPWEVVREEWMELGRFASSESAIRSRWKMETECSDYKINHHFRIIALFDGEFELSCECSGYWSEEKYRQIPCRSSRQGKALITCRAGEDIDEAISRAFPQSCWVSPGQCVSCAKKEEDDWYNYREKESAKE